MNPNTHMRNERQEKRKKETHHGDGQNDDDDNGTAQRDLDDAEHCGRERDRGWASN